MRSVVFTNYVEGARPRMIGIPRAEAAFNLAEIAFNRSEFGPRAASILSDLVRNAECFNLQAGAIDETCDLIERRLAPPPATTGRAHPAAQRTPAPEFVPETV